METLNQSSIRSGERRIADVVEIAISTSSDTRSTNPQSYGSPTQHAPSIASMENRRAAAPQ
jgi:hypothetical protein